MHRLQEQAFSTICVIFVLLPFVGCSSHGKNQDNSHKSFTKHVNKVSSQMVFEITLHGILLWASMGFLVPLGILVIRLSNKDHGEARPRILFYVHAVLQMLSVLLTTAGAILSIKNFENSFNNSHQRIGLALYAAIWVQALAGFRRPKRGSKGRKVWYLLHWVLGTTISMVGIFNTYTGLKAYKKRTSRSINLLAILFTAQVSFMAFLYLFQDKWEYIQNQGVIMGSETTTSLDQVLPQTNNRKEVLMEPSRKSTALGSHISKSNALNRLFQLT